MLKNRRCYWCNAECYGETCNEHRDIDNFYKRYWEGTLKSERPARESNWRKAHEWMSGDPPKQTARQ